MNVVRSYPLTRQVVKGVKQEGSQGITTIAWAEPGLRLMAARAAVAPMVRFRQE